MYQILFDDKVVRVGIETKEEVEKAVKTIISEFEKKAVMRKKEQNNPRDAELAKHEYELEKKAAMAFNKVLPGRLSVFEYKTYSDSVEADED